MSFQPAVEEIMQNELRNIIARQARENPDNPLSALAGALFGAQAQTPPPAQAEPPAEGQSQTGESAAPQQPAPEAERTPESTARDVLGGIFRRATEGQRQQEQQPAPEAEKQGE